jgi:hypothetical protein
MSEFDDLRDRLDAVEETLELDDGLTFVSEADGYGLSPDEFRERYGEAPAESDGLVIHIPEEAAEY